MGVVPIRVGLTPHDREAFALGPDRVPAVLRDVDARQHSPALVAAPIGQHRERPRNGVRIVEFSAIGVDQDVALLEFLQFHQDDVGLPKPVAPAARPVENVPMARIERGRPQIPRPPHGDAPRAMVQGRLRLCHL